MKKKKFIKGDFMDIWVKRVVYALCNYDKEGSKI